MQNAALKRSGQTALRDIPFRGTSAVGEPIYMFLVAHLQCPGRIGVRVACASERALCAGCYKEEIYAK